jgi:hypothetical protein
LAARKEVIPDYIFLVLTENVNGRNWIAVLSLIVFVGHYNNYLVPIAPPPSLRPWLVRHVIGNFVLAVGLVAAWRYDVAVFYDVAS